MILGIETSCDECSASIVRKTPDASSTLEVLSLATFSQIEIHQPFGGVVPEVASRNHLETVNLMIEKAISDANIRPEELSAIAVTNRPGLVGALLVGVSAAKAYAYAWKKPLVAVHHLEGHLASLFLRPFASENAEVVSEPEYPLLVCLVSGGHTNLYVIQKPPQEWDAQFLQSAKVGSSRDDAAGEAFDKTAKLLGFPYPGGVWIEKNAKNGDALKYLFPRALPQKATLDYSFSGLKTAVSLQIEKLKQAGTLKQEIPHLSASIQSAIVEALVRKMKLAVTQHHCRSLAVVGGVAANRYLRDTLFQGWKDWGLVQEPHFPKMTYCTDNAAMIAAAGYYRFQQGAQVSPEQLLRLNAIAYPDS